MNYPSLYKAGSLNADFSWMEKIWVYTRLVQMFLSGVLVIKTILHFMCGWSPNVYPIIIANGIILIYISGSLRLHRRRDLTSRFDFWSINGHIDLAGMVGCIIIACASSLSSRLRHGLCDSSWGYCPNRGFHIVWMSFLCVAFALSAILCFYLHFVGSEGRIALPAREDFPSHQPVRSSSIAALAIAVPGTRSMNPDTVIQGAVNYISNLQREARARGATGTSELEGASGESGSIGTTVLVPDLAAKLSAIVARIEAMERSNDSKE
ncbi:hypothetical protein C7212DRAFT_359316 [Tuber magnatum]|uniref:Uncharacterized protein n=1 Tax=Tuber magnatum TaxID=42249 RepID=A0A317SL27_9PEZI|nr:hypothetical protein C7212DRAFT_359316 [Tuber magnatum]